MRPPKAVFPLLMIALVPLMTSCAFGARQVTLTYPPAPPPDLGPSAAAGSIASRKARQPIALVPFADRRSDKRVIGEVRGTAWGVRTADVVADNDVATWVSQALRLELERAGYLVTVVDRDTPTGETPVLSGEIRSVYCTALLSYEAKVSFSASVTTDGKEIFRKRYRGEGSAGSNFAAAGSSYGHSLSLALAEAAGRLVSDLNSLFFTTLR